MKKKEKKFSKTLGTFEAHEKMLKERIRRLKEDDGKSFEQLLNQANFISS